MILFVIGSWFNGDFESGLSVWSTLHYLRFANDCNNFFTVCCYNIFLIILGKYLADAGYNKWELGQPDNWRNEEHCGSMYRNGLLNDVACDVKAMFVCEKQIASPFSA